MSHNAPTNSNTHTMLINKNRTTSQSKWYSRNSKKKRFQVFNEPKQHLQTQLYRRVYTIFFSASPIVALSFFSSMFLVACYFRGEKTSAASFCASFCAKPLIMIMIMTISSLVIRTWNVLMCCKQIRKIYTKYIRNEFMCAMMHADQFNYLWSDNWNRFDVLYLELFWMQNSA